MEAFWIFLKGMMMGAADVVPGVSGGTIAFITGIYDRLVKGLSDISSAGKELLSGNLNRGIRMVDFRFFMPLLGGIVIAFALGSVAIPALIARYPAPVFSFFIGLIIASIHIVYKKIESHSWKTILLGAAGLAAGFAVAALPLVQFQANLWLIFLLGIAAICAMLLPGISGSYVLLMFGQYDYMLHALRDLQFPVIIVFSLGALIGLLGFARFLQLLLKRYHSATFATLAGIMIGALYRPAGIVYAHATEPWTMLVFLILGGMLVFVVEYVART